MKVQYFCGSGHPPTPEQVELIIRLFPEADIEDTLHVREISCATDKLWDLLSGQISSVDWTISGRNFLDAMCDRRLAIGTRIIEWDWCNWPKELFYAATVYHLTEGGWIRERHIKYKEK